jgi:hypothetical protein
VFSILYFTFYKFPRHVRLLSHRKSEQFFFYFLELCVLIFDASSYANFTDHNQFFVCNSVYLPVTSNCFSRLLCNVMSYEWNVFYSLAIKKHQLFVSTMQIITATFPRNFPTSRFINVCCFLI